MAEALRASPWFWRGGAVLLLIWPLLRQLQPVPVAALLAWDAAAAAGLVIGVLFWLPTRRTAAAGCVVALLWLAGCQWLRLPARTGLLPLVVGLPVLASLQRAGPGCVAEARVAGAGVRLLAGGVVLPLAMPGLVIGLGLGVAANGLPVGWALALALAVLSVVARRPGG